MNKLLHNDSGTALVVTLAIVAILLAAALQMARFTGDNIMVTLSDKDQFKAGQMALSGIEMARLILSEDAAENNIDSVQEAWADPEKLSRAVSQLGLDQGQLKIKINDELSKIQVNALIMQFPGNQINPDQVRIWENFLRLRFADDKDKEESDPTLIIYSIKDWLDSKDDDAITGLFGAESDYYLDLDPPYECGNAPFNSIVELFNVKGISRDFLNNKKIEPGDLFTVYGLGMEKSENGGFRYPGKININTAGVEVLSAMLPEGMQDLALDLADFRSQKTQEEDMFVNSLEKGWYKNIIELTQKEQARFERIITYSSNIFTIEATAKQNAATIRLVAALKREKDKASGKWRCRIIQVKRK